MNPTHVYNFLNIRTPWRTQTECPSFPVGTDDARDPSVLASPLGLMAHAAECPSFAFGTNGARGSVSFGPN